MLSEEFGVSNPSVLVVPKDKIAANGDFNFSGERYQNGDFISSHFPMVELGDIAEVTSSKRILAEEYVSVGIPFYRTKEIVELNKGKEISLELFISRERFESIKSRFGSPVKGDILISSVGTIGIS